VPEGGVTTSWRTDVRWMVAEGAPWVGRRARDLGPWAVRLAWTEARGAREGARDGGRAGVREPVGVHVGAGQ